MNNAAEVLPLAKQFRTDLQKFAGLLRNAQWQEAENLRTELNLRYGQLGRKLAAVDQDFPWGTGDVLRGIDPSYGHRVADTIDDITRSMEPMLGDLYEQSQERGPVRINWPPIIVVLAFGAGFLLRPYAHTIVDKVKTFSSLSISRQAITVGATLTWGAFLGIWVNLVSSGFWQALKKHPKKFVICVIGTEVVEAAAKFEGMTRAQLHAARQDAVARRDWLAMQAITYLMTMTFEGKPK